jgi:hypothetical protein
MSDPLAVRRAIEAVVDLVESTSLTPEERLSSLPRALDWLAAVAHGVNGTFDQTSYPDGPSKDYQATFAMVGVISRRWGTTMLLSQSRVRSPNARSVLAMRLMILRILWEISTTYSGAGTTQVKMTLSGSFVRALHRTGAGICANCNFTCT